MISTLTGLRSKHTTSRIVAVLVFALASAAAVGARFYFEPGAAISQTNAAAIIRVTAVGRDDSYDTIETQGTLAFHVKVRGTCDDGWKVGSATVKVQGKIHDLVVNKSLGSIGLDNGEKWSFQVATFPYLPPDTQASPVAMCNAELERRLARGDSRAEILSKGFDLTVPQAYFAELSVACLRKKLGFLESYHPYADTKLPVTISCQPTAYKVERTPGTPKRTPGAPKRTPSLPGRLPMPDPQLEFIGKEPYDLNGTQGTRYKLSVTNRASHPDFLWHPSPQLPACGKDQNASRTWVEIFGSPGNERLGGFCRLSSSQDLAQLWFATPAGEKGPPCVYIVMTDRETGQKYESNRVCSRLFSSVSGGIKANSDQTERLRRERREKWIEITSNAINESGVNVRGGSGSDRIFNSANGSTTRSPDSGTTNDKEAKLAQPDLSIRQFLFPPTNDKALRVHVVNTGQAPSAACRLVLTVRKINGVAVGRTIQVDVPALAAGAEDWLLIDARSILPNNVSLQSATFRLNVDGTEIVAESNETNNEVWHNQ